MSQISERVQDELNEAEGHLRNAFSWAARTEKPVTIKLLSSILQSIEEVPIVDRNANAIEMIQANFIKKLSDNGEPPAV